VGSPLPVQARRVLVREQEGAVWLPHAAAPVDADVTTATISSTEAGWKCGARDRFLDVVAAERSVA